MGIIFHSNKSSHTEAIYIIKKKKKLDLNCGRNDFFINPQRNAQEGYCSYSVCLSVCLSRSDYGDY